MIDELKAASRQWPEGKITQLNESSCVIQGATPIKVKWGLTAEACHFLQREALWLQRLSKLLGANWSSCCIALERVGHAQVLFTSYLAGVSLAELKEGLSPEQRQTLAHVIFPALKARLVELQRHQIVHGDIKLANIIFDETQQLSLIDFANARRVGESFSGTGFQQFTPSYLSAQSNDLATFERDLYAAKQCLINWFQDSSQPTSSASLSSIPLALTSLFCDP